MESATLSGTGENCEEGTRTYDQEPESLEGKSVGWRKGRGGQMQEVRVVDSDQVL